MKVCNQYSHHDAYNILIQKSGLLPEIIEILDDSDVVFGVNNPRQIKTKITTRIGVEIVADKNGRPTSNVLIQQ